ncbi:DUF6126 family protein [Streptomyces sp. NPDC087917]|uniref:DUF6126 family protein n=1 Tax=Streptomyces sp. NPDC087917 TaxID=3155060 RepID=UPI00343D25EA
MPQGENVSHAQPTAAPQPDAAPQVRDEARGPIAPEPAAATAPEPAAATAPVRSRIESKFPRGLVIRLVAYLFVGHLFAFFVYLLFVLGAENQ